MTPVDACVSVSLLLCVHTYTLVPFFATLITLAIPYDDCIVCMQARQYSVHSHFAHVQIDYWITPMFTTKARAAVVVLKEEVDKELVCKTLSSG